MKLLLDTHVLLWWIADGRQLKAQARSAIAEADLVWASAVSGWEMAIKSQRGKLQLDDAVDTLIADAGFDELSATLAHAERFRNMPSHHTDPFDRFLIAQAQVEGATIVTHDRQFGRYDVPVLWT
ncbi:MAG: type II toxin-antitoxin system VapC family toxin [Vicinamibacterales bacterium]